MPAVVGYLLQMILPAAFAGVLFLLVRPLRRKRLAQRGLVSGPWREAGLLLFVMFLAGLAFLTMLPRMEWRGGRPVFLTDAGMGGVNLVPGGSLKMLWFCLTTGLWDSLLINFPGNILMFSPIGFFIPLLWDRPRWYRAVFASFCTSFLIEFVQLFVARGTDVDDLILNTLGGLVGYWTFLLLRRIFPDFTAKFKLAESR